MTKTKTQEHREIKGVSVRPDWLSIKWRCWTGDPDKYTAKLLAPLESGLLVNVTFESEVDEWACGPGGFNGLAKGTLVTGMPIPTDLKPEQEVKFNDLKGWFYRVGEFKKLTGVDVLVLTKGLKAYALTASQIPSGISGGGPASA